MQQDIGTLIRQCRLAAALTQSELAARAGTTQAMVARYESGVVSPTVRTLERLIRAGGMKSEVSLLPLDRASMSGPIGRQVLQRRREIRRMAAAMGARNVRVFGSVARGDESVHSDLDLLVDFPVHQRGLLPLAHLADGISAIVHVPVDVVADSTLAPEVAARARPEAIAL